MAEPSRRARGFTLIEMMVVVAIVGILTTAIVGNYGSFRSATVATNMAYEIAASLRQAQLYGLGVKIYGTAPSEGSTYGVEFSAVSDDAASAYAIFHDKKDEVTGVADGACEAGGACNCADAANECVEQVRMIQSVRVEALCASPDASVSTAGLLAGLCSFQHLAVTFTRPNPEAVFYEDLDPAPDTRAALAGILIRGGSHCRLVRMYSNGQVAVETVSPATAAGTRFEQDCNGA